MRKRLGEAGNAASDDGVDKLAIGAGTAVVGRVTDRNEGRAGKLAGAVAAGFRLRRADNLTAGNAPSEIWRQILCVFGAGIAGLTAFARLSLPLDE